MNQWPNYRVVGGGGVVFRHVLVRPFFLLKAKPKKFVLQPKNVMRRVSFVVGSALERIFVFVQTFEHEKSEFGLETDI